MKISDLPKSRYGIRRPKRGRRGCRKSKNHPKGKEYVSNIKINGLVHCLGYSKTLEDGQELFYKAFVHVYGSRPW